MGAAPSVLLPALAVGLSAAMASIARLFGHNPNSSNDTLLQAENHAREAEEAARREREHQEHQAYLQRERDRLEKERAEFERQHREAEEKARLERERAEEEAKRQREEAERMRREAEERERAHREENERREKEYEETRRRQEDETARLRGEAGEAERRTAEQLQREREERERVAAEAAAREAAIQAEMAALEAAAAAEAEAAKKRAEELEAAKVAAETAHRKGIRPVVWPTLQQIENAKQTLQIDPTKLHFAVCGASGSGKSSFINALRGLRKSDPGAAATGFVETTREITRYPDPRVDIYPYSRFVWYDVPGAGTLSVPDWQYFNDFGLFVFDFIVLVYDVRFTKIDVGILENCKRFNIPTFIVRSKSDQNIRNELANCDIDSDDEEEAEAMYEEVKARYVQATVEDARRNLDLMVKENPELDGMQEKRVYVVSNQTMYGLLSTKPGKKKKDVDPKKVIHEVELVEDMLMTAKRRRYDRVDGDGVVGQSRGVVARAEEGLRGLVAKLNLRGGEGWSENEEDFVTVEA